MPNPIDVGTGTQIAFGTSGFAPYILDVNPPSMSRDPVDTTHMQTTGGKTFRPGDLYDGGQVTFQIGFDPSMSPPMLAAEQPEQITITFPTPSGMSSGATWVFSAFMVEFSPAVPLEDKMTASVTLKVTGSVAITAAA